MFYIAISFLASVFEQGPIVQLPTPEVVRPVEPAPEKPKPWEKVPQQEAFLNRCWNNSYQLEAVTIPTWKMGSVSCSPTGMSVAWTITNVRGARLAWVKAALDRYKFNRVNVKLDPSGTQASGNITYSDIPYEVSLPSLSINQIREQLTDIKQATALPIQFSEQIIRLWQKSRIALRVWQMFTASI